MRLPILQVALTLLLLNPVPEATAQPANKKKDSLLTALREPMADSLRVNTLNALTETVLKTKPKEALNYSSEAIKLSKESGYRVGEINAYFNRSDANRQLRNFDKSMEDLYQALRMVEADGRKKLKAELYIRYGKLYADMSVKEKAITYYNSALQMFREMKDKKGEAKCYEELGHYDWMNAEYERSLLEYFHSEKIKQEIGDEPGLSFTYQWIGNNYFYLGNLEKARAYYYKSLELAKKHDIKTVAAYDVQNLGFIYMNEEKLDEAEKQFLASLDLFTELGDDAGIVYSYQALGTLYSRWNKPALVISSWNKSIEHSRRSGARAYTALTYSYLYEFYREKGELKNALEYQQLYYELNDSLMREENSAKITRLEEKYESDKKENEARNKLRIAEEERRSAETIRNLLVAGIFLALLLVAAVFRGYRQKQRSNDEISRQKQIIEDKNKDITDSINYARRIQEAILPSREVKEKLFPQSFILLKPKDIVSGDFYWLTERNGKSLIAAADCTGHGVPGAFMSMIGSAFLNEIVNELGETRPASILDMLRSKIIASLKQNDLEDKIANPAGIKMHDGMDIALLCFDGNTLEYAGANNPLWIINPARTEWPAGAIPFTEVPGGAEVPADKQPVGFEDKEARPFTNYRMTLQKGDTLYIFTDGYADQFGGAEGKKFKYRQLKESLVALYGLPIAEQREQLLQGFEKWRNELEQIDDVLIIGIVVDL